MLKFPTQKALFRTFYVKYQTLSLFIPLLCSFFFVILSLFDFSFGHWLFFKLVPLSFKHVLSFFCYYFLSTYLPYDTTRCSRPALHFSFLGLAINYIIKKSWFLLLGNDVWNPRSRCWVCPLVVSFVI